MSHPDVAEIEAVRHPALLEQAPAIGLNALLPLGSRLVVVAPHPDDEVLMAGGLIAQHAMRGGEVQVLAVTEGEASHRGMPDWVATDLARRRAEESRCGLARLAPGDGTSVMRESLGFQDGAVAARQAPLVDALMARLRFGDLLVGTWLQDGHPDHDACAHALLAACERLQLDWVLAPVWWWDRRGSSAEAQRPPGPGRLWDGHRLHRLPLPSWAWARKQQALACHESQWEPRPRADDRPGEGVLGPSTRQRAEWPWEAFFVPVPAGRPDPR